MKRVVITGMGVVSPIGNTVEEFWSAIKENKRGFSFIDDIVSEDFEVRIAAPVKDFSPEKYMDKKEAKRMDRFTQFAVYSALEAMADASSCVVLQSRIAPLARLSQFNSVTLIVP